jgi:hypothetical protein
MTEWIKCSDRLPEKEDYYLCYDHFKNFKIYFFYPNHWIDRNVSHWQELPEPPKENK